jgi:hypothetical protein
VEVGNPIYNTFHYCNFFQIYTDFELIRRFQIKADLTDLCSNRLIATFFQINQSSTLDKESSMLI